MASPEVSRKVKMLGTWNEDVFTDEIVKTIAALAKSEKGKTVKVVLSRKGVKLTRSKLFKERKTTVFPIGDLRTITRSPDFSQCVLLILSNVDKKYKIIALRCASEKDAVHLVSGFGEIQKHLSSSRVELKKKDNGNWTLRERLFPRSRKLVTDVYSDRTPNGGVTVGAENGTVMAYRASPEATDAYTAVSYQKGVYTKRSTSGNSNSSKVHKKNYFFANNVGDDYVIETEVLPSSKTTTEVHTRHHSDDIRKHKGRPEYVSKNILEVDKRRIESGNHLVYSGHSVPSPGKVVYSTTSRNHVPTQPVIYREPSSRTYEARIEPPAAHYPKLVQGRGRDSLRSDTLPVRVWGGNWNMTFDQRSVRSNTSKTSHSRRKRSSEFYYPTTVVRSIEKTYPRPPVVFRRGTDQIIAYRPGADNYYIVEPREPHGYFKERQGAGQLPY
ncbi:unnamed protein product [Candidula unifasciata]|uniref:Uncharacterized protein n=1 Tax=Candidula unifasciata TaxID=100452 RepID=A0A8S3ZL16_9EUPU|nr:unnamed protein product [Candidula unifasciata]